MRKIFVSAIVFGFVLAVSRAHAAPLRLRTGSIEPPPKTSASAALKASAARAHYLLQFRGPVRPEWKSALRNLGIRLYDYIPDYAFIVGMTGAQARRALQLDYVRWVEPLAARHRKDQSLDSVSSAAAQVIIHLFQDESFGAVRSFIEAAGGKIVEGGDSVYRAEVPARIIERIAAMEEVKWIEEWVQPRVTNNVAAGIIGAEAVRTRLGLYGAGQVIAIADTGLDTGQQATLSADFAGRLLKAYAIRRPGDWSDLTGHGTHITGIATGSGVLSGSNPSGHLYTGSFAGVAPEAQFIMQSIGDASEYLYPPANLSDLFLPAYTDGARVHSDSWGSPVRGKYTTYSQQVDDFVWNYRDLVLVFPAGNDGKDANADGITDLMYMYAPATAKNCIAVGATENVRSTGRVTRYGWAWPLDFPADPLHNDYISDNAGGMVAWSDRGPCADGRIKPDICAPGTNIISCRTHAGSSPTGWGAYDANYIYWGGTSMSTPMVAGAAALVREYYIKIRSVQPSAALVKATLLNSATDITPGQYAPPYPQEVPRRPNNVEGWGRLNLSAAIDPPAPRVVSFVDETSGLNTGQSRNYAVQVLGNSLPLSVTLVWTDPPGAPLAARELVNNLDLTVTDPEARVYRGNGVVDAVNNVETVDLLSPVQGAYTVTVSAVNVPTGPQPFALVISGQITGGYIAGCTRTESGKPVAGASITVSAEGFERTTATDESGGYTVHVPDGSYTVTASKSGWTFSPPSRAVEVSGVGVGGADFIGSAPAGQITGTVTKAVGGKAQYLIESPHPYNDNSNLLYTVAGHPSATSIRAHIAEMKVQSGYDVIKIEDSAGNLIEQITGTRYDYWTSWVAGNSLRIRLVSDSSLTDYGFRVDQFETDLVTQGPKEGVTISAGPGGGSADSQSNGGFAISPLEPVAYSVVPSLGSWTFDPAARFVSVPPGGTTAGVDFYAFPPASISGTVKAGTISQQPKVIDTDGYPDNAYIVYVCEGPTGASRIRVHFTLIDVEGGFDFVHVADMAGNIIDTYTGEHADVWSSWVVGNSLKIILTSDDAFNYYGFITDVIETVSNERGVGGISVSLQPGGASTTTTQNGSFAFSAVVPGVYTVSASAPYWSFAPASSVANAVSGMAVEGIDFFGVMHTMPGIGYAKSVPDGTEVYLTGQVVVAGSDEFDGCLYIEEPNRSMGIRVVTQQTVACGATVAIRGVMSTQGGERQIVAISVTVL